MGKYRHFSPLAAIDKLEEVSKNVKSKEIALNTQLQYDD
jgi:hypothetical protein